MKLALLFGLVVALAAASPALAQTRAEAGLRLAQQWCTTCHQVEPGAQTTDVAPPWPSLANDRAGDFGWVRMRLQNPPYPMTGINLSNTQIDNIVAYFETLRER